MTGCRLRFSLHDLVRPDAEVEVVLQRHADQVGDRVLRGLRQCFLTVRSVAASRCGSAGFCVRRAAKETTALKSAAVAARSDKP